MRYIAFNKEQELSFEETEIPTINDDECLIKVSAIGVNRADILQRQGNYPAPPGESSILGIEACGELFALGKSAQNWQQGDKVLAIVPGGAYAQYVKVKTEHLIKLPHNLNYVDGASIAEVFLTAYQCLFTIANLQPKTNVLIHAGASGVGTAAIQLAKYINCHVTVTVGSEEKCLACKALGADEVINYQETNFVEWSKKAGRSYDVILDVVAGEYVNKNINVCALDGHIVMLSMLGGRYAESVDVAKMLLKRVNMHATTLRSRSDKYKSELIKDFTENFYHCFESGSLNPVIYKNFNWQEVDIAHHTMLSNANIGKLVLTVD
ncbi:MAG: NAD(P)H-quinone oxidoreductase [Colwellia polaris]